jgi:hypothetical protein
MCMVIDGLVCRAAHVKIDSYSLGTGPWSWRILISEWKALTASVVQWSEFLATQRKCIVFPVRYVLNLNVVCGLVVRVPGYTTEMYCVSCEVRTEFIYGMWSSGQSSWLHNADVLCFLWGTNWIYIWYVEESRPPLWSSGQSSWLQIRRPGFDSRHYQKKLMGLERGPLSLVSTTEEQLDRKVAAPVYKTENTVRGIRHADRVAPSIHTSWQSLRRQAAVARSV